MTVVVPPSLLSLGLHCMRVPRGPCVCGVAHRVRYVCLCECMGVCIEWPHACSCVCSDAPPAHATDMCLLSCVLLQVLGLSNTKVRGCMGQWASGLCSYHSLCSCHRTSIHVYQLPQLPAAWYWVRKPAPWPPSPALTTLQASEPNTRLPCTLLPPLTRRSEQCRQARSSYVSSAKV